MIIRYNCVTIGILRKRAKKGILDMRAEGLGGYKSITEFVEAKVKIFGESEISFRTLFELMFREKENVLYEKSAGYRIIETTCGQAYREIESLSGAIQKALPHAKAGAVVGLYLENSLLWIESFWAILAAGFRPLLMNLRLSHETLEQALRDLGAEAVFAQGIEFSIPTFDPAALLGSNETFPQGSFGEEIYVMSSGTSETVKVCGYGAQEFYHLLQNSAGIVARCKQIRTHYEGRLKQLCFLPFYHIFGLVAVYLWFGFFSRTFVELPDLSPQTILNTIRRHKVTHIFAVPLFWEKVYDGAMKTITGRGEKTVQKFRRGLAISRKIGDLPLLGSAFRKLAFREVRENLFGESVSFMITGGAAIRPEVLEFFNAIGYFLTDGYGATEIGITSVEQSKKAKIRNAAFVGTPMDGIEYKISESGELLVRGKAIAKVILEHGKPQEIGEYFATRDLAEEIGGHYRILGRLDDLIVGADGENLNPNLIEPKLSVPSVRGCCLLGAEQGGGKAAVLLVSVDRYLSAEKFDQIDRGIREILEQISGAKAIRKIAYTSDPLLLPEEFKLNRRRLTHAYAEGTLSLLETAKNRENERFDELYEKLCEFFALSLSKERSELGGDYDFFLDGGGTSLDYFAMVTAISEEFSLSFPQSGGRSLSTPNEFYEYIKAQKNDVDSTF